MAVLKPLKLVIENYPEGQEEELEFANHPQKPEMGTRKVPFSRELYIESSDFHEDPQVLHYGKPGTGMALEAGMTFTIEPMVNAGKRYTKLLPDGWTVVTKDHSLSAQWEHTILVTDSGHEVLTCVPGDDI